MPVLLSFCLTVQQPSSPPPPAPPPAKRTVEFTGTVLMNGFYNSACTNNNDDPVFADTHAVDVKGSSAPIRRSSFPETFEDLNEVQPPFACRVHRVTRVERGRHRRWVR